MAKAFNVISFFPFRLSTQIYSNFVSSSLSALSSIHNDLCCLGQMKGKRRHKITIAMMVICENNWEISIEILYVKVICFAYLTKLNAIINRGKICELKQWFNLNKKLLNIPFLLFSVSSMAFVNRILVETRIIFFDIWFSFHIISQILD